MIESMKLELGGRKAFQTASESEAEWIVLETRESFPASTGVVRDIMVARHPSGKSSNSVILFFFTTFI